VGAAIEGVPAAAFARAERDVEAALVPAEHLGGERVLVADRPARVADRPEDEQRHRRRPGEAVNDADDQGPRGPVGAQVGESSV
jgi:hypothetical protein